MPIHYKSDSESDLVEVYTKMFHQQELNYPLRNSCSKQMPITTDYLIKVAKSNAKKIGGKFNRVI